MFFDFAFYLPLVAAYVLPVVFAYNLYAIERRYDLNPSGWRRFVDRFTDSLGTWIAVLAIPVLLTIGSFLAAAEV